MYKCGDDLIEVKLSRVGSHSLLLSLHPFASLSSNIFTSASKKTVSVHRHGSLWYVFSAVCDVIRLIVTVH